MAARSSGDRAGAWSSAVAVAAAVVFGAVVISFCMAFFPFSAVAAVVIPSEAVAAISATVAGVSVAATISATRAAGAAAVAGLSVLVMTYKTNNGIIAATMAAAYLWSQRAARIKREGRGVGAPSSSSSSVGPATKSPGTVAGAQAGDDLVGQKCPLCGEGHIIKGKAAYGCSRWKEGCTWRKAFRELGNEVRRSQLGIRN